MNTITVSIKARMSVLTKLFCLIAFAGIISLSVIGCQKQKDDKAAIQQRDDKAAIIEILEFDKMIGDMMNETIIEFKRDVISRMNIDSGGEARVTFFSFSLKSLMVTKSMQKKLNQTEVCNEFKTAYQEHIDAWNKKSILYKKIWTLHNLNSATTDYYESQEEQISNEISVTFNKVLSVAEKYGVDVSKYK